MAPSVQFTSKPVLHVTSSSARHARNLAGAQHLHLTTAPHPPTPTHETPTNLPSQWHSRGKPPVLRTHLPLRNRPRTLLEQLDSEDQTTDNPNSYNRYIAVASRVVRRSLKEDKRIAAERRGESELRFAKWEVSLHCIRHGTSGGRAWRWGG